MEDVHCREQPPRLAPVLGALRQPLDDAVDQAVVRRHHQHPPRAAAAAATAALLLAPLPAAPPSALRFTAGTFGSGDNISYLLSKTHLSFLSFLCLYVCPEPVLAK